MKLLTKRNLARATALAVVSRKPLATFSRSLRYALFWKLMRDIFRWR